MTTTPLDQHVANALSLNPSQVHAAITLFDEGCTVPFIARYRKERTGSLDEVQLRAIEVEMDKARQLEAKRTSILKGLKEQGVNDRALLHAVQSATSLTRLEDLWAPYRPKRQTLAQKAIEAGLTPVADALSKGQDEIFAELKTHTSPQFNSTDAVLQGARHILAERLADDAEVRDHVRQKAQKFGRLASKKKRGTEPHPTYKLYLDFEASSSRLRPHQVLAMRRGEKEGALSLKLVGEDRWMERILSSWQRKIRSPKSREQVELAIQEAYKRLLLPQAEREVRSTLETKADEHAIDVFALNLKNLLLSPPMPGHTILGFDPGLRTGSKVAIVDPTGDILHTATLSTLDHAIAASAKALASWLVKYNVTLIAIGNGTGTHQAQQTASQAIQSIPGSTTRWTVVDEAGASIYSASQVAREELPHLDVSIRGAVSIARRLQDPLAELIKIDPKSIGVGMYQHDVNQSTLSKKLQAVVEDVVHAVGVDLNTASAPLLANVSGLGPSTAKNIIAHRTEHGPFRSRAQLHKVKGLGAKTFEQCAGFLRIRGGSEPLDDTSIHPESYRLAKAIAKSLPSRDPGAVHAMLREQAKRDELEAITARHGAGRPTLLDMLAGLTGKTRDPRADLDPPVLRDRILEMKDLQVGMKFTGAVRNVVDFGAFVDIGVKQDGLIHISQLGDGRTRVSSPYDHLSVGQTLEVEVLEVDLKRGRIALGMG